MDAPSLRARILVIWPARIVDVVSPLGLLILAFVLLALSICCREFFAALHPPPPPGTPLA